jgi:DNA-binding HxlR family transcriptional regulator
MTEQEGTRALHGHSGVTNVDNEFAHDEKKFKEIFCRAKDMPPQLCPVRDILARISDKWSMLTILALGANGTLRFNEIKNLIGDVSQRMLTVTLRNLEADGFITRKVYPEVPPRVEYSATPIGLELMTQVGQLADWAVDNSKRIIKARRKNKTAARQELR